MVRRNLAATVLAGVAVLVGAGRAAAQGKPGDGCPEQPACCPAAPPLPCLYGSAELLFWWVKDVNVVPLVTANPNPNTIASLREPGTTILFGGSGRAIDFDSITGVRGTLGGWLPGCVVGFEGSLFGLPRQSHRFVASSVGGDAGVIAVPFNSTVAFAANPAGETTFNPGNTPSQVTVNATTQLWGAEALGQVMAFHTEGFSVALLGGFRYLDLEEDLTLGQLFLSTRVPGVLTVQDTFSAQNQFYGAAVGARVGASVAFVNLDVTGKVAVGANRQQVTVAGATTATGRPFGVAPGVTPAGVFALPSNAGELARNRLTVAPEVQARLACAVGRHLDLWVAYEFLYINDVVRAGDQINRNLNPTQNVVFGVPNGLPAPPPSLTRTDFWAQGVSAGVRVSY